MEIFIVEYHVVKAEKVKIFDIISNYLFQIMYIKEIYQIFLTSFYILVLLSLQQFSTLHIHVKQKVKSCVEVNLYVRRAKIDFRHYLLVMYIFFIFLKFDKLL